MSSEFNLSCPFPIQSYPQVLMAHGGGGKLMHQLIGKMFLPAFRNPLSESQHDASVFEVGGQRLAFTTDSFVVRPLFFPGGDLGSLAVHGTVNDLAMAGARPWAPWRFDATYRDSRTPLFQRGPQSFSQRLYEEAAKESASAPGGEVPAEEANDDEVVDAEIVDEKG